MKNNMTKVEVPDSIGKTYAKGEIEFIVRDPITKHVFEHRVQPNIVKIFAKEILSHRMGHSKVWDPSAGTGSGDWVASTIDPAEDFSVKYIMFGASFNDDGVPLDTNDTRFYTEDTVTHVFIPIRLGPGAEYDGGLVNAVPISEPNRPLKRVEAIGFNTTYQPSGTPLMQADVRALNNVVIFETTLRSEEYNGLGLAGSDYFTITEVALVGGKELGLVGACECDPHELFLEGNADNQAILAAFSGGDSITIDNSATLDDIELLKEGDQIKLVDAGDTAGDTDSISQLSPYYLITAKSATGREIQLDRDRKSVV